MYENLIIYTLNAYKDLKVLYAFPDLIPLFNFEAKLRILYESILFIDMFFNIFLPLKNKRNLHAKELIYL